MKQEVKASFRTLVIAILALTVIVLVVLYSEGRGILSENGRTPITSSEITYKDITPETLNSMLQLKSSHPFFLLNVDDASPAKSINGTDAFLNYSTIIENKDKLPKDPNSRIVIYSTDGNMSKIAAQKLLIIGYKDIFNLKDGTQGWEAKKFPVVKK